MENQKNTIQLLEESLLDPQFRKSKQRLNNILDDSFIEHASSGGVFDKKQTIESLLLEETPHFTMSNFSIRNLSQDVILATYQVQKKLGQSEFKNSNRCSIWKKISGNWKMIFHQGTNCH